MTHSTLLEVQNLTVALPEKADRAWAVQDVCFSVAKGEMVCIVGESGSGKSISAKAIMGLLPPLIPITQGQIFYQGTNLLKLDQKQIRSYRGQHFGMIFQEPMKALNPLFQVGKLMSDILRQHTNFNRFEIQKHILDIFEKVRLPEPEKMIKSYPFMLSGGQRQRIMIAMALAMKPNLLIADEPTTALDVTTQAQILKLIADLQNEYGMGVIFITHDFGVVAEIADRVLVMQKGQIVEQGQREDVLLQPQHPYTQQLIDALPSLSSQQTSTFRAHQVLLESQSLQKCFSGQRTVQALDRVSFTLHHQETLGVVGESGSGKSTLGRCLIRLIEADSGQVWFEGQELYSIQQSHVFTKDAFSFSDDFSRPLYLSQSS